jgi:F-type H+-transporting ATPase subunit delta
MAEIATIARPYAEALFKVAGADTQVGAVVEQVKALGEIARDPQLRQWADDPRVTSSQVFDIIAGMLTLEPRVQNFLRTVLANNRMAALPEIAAQFQALVNARAGVSDATVYSAFPIAADQLTEVVAALEKRFGRKLNAVVQVQPELIGGIRVVVGDEVLDTSVKARLEQMKVALTA